jgi:hypothetical protein
MDEKIFNKGYKYKPIKTKRLLLVKVDIKYKEELYNLYINKKIWVYNGGSNNNYLYALLKNHLSKFLIERRNPKQISLFKYISI